MIFQNPPEVLRAKNVEKFPYDLPSNAQPVTKTITIDGNTLGKLPSKLTLV